MRRSERCGVHHRVEAGRLSLGECCPRSATRIGEGDISASYSGDRIALNQPLRRPFWFRNERWVCSGSATVDGKRTAEAYRLVEPEAFEGTTTTYRQKTSDAEAARRDPNGFYHGMAVQTGGRTFILVGPPGVFRAAEPGQLNLFG